MSAPPELGLARLLRGGALPVPHGTRVAAQRARFLNSIGPELGRVHARHRAARWLWVGLAAIGLTALRLALGVHDAGESPGHMQVALEKTALHEGDWIESRTHDRTLRFSEGSQVQMAPHSKARIGHLRAKQVDITLESGRLQAQITKRTGVAWSIGAGPYRVTVVGTRFEVHWDFALDRFDVRVSEGEVRIYGASLPPEGIRLTRGQSFTRDKPAAPDDAPGEALPKRPSTQNHEPSQPAFERPSHAMAPTRSQESPKVESWQGLARAGNYAVALAKARRAGLTELLADSSADDMLLLANTARFAGDLETARRTFLTLRARYPGHSAARLAAFSLGRLASDSLMDTSETVRWFRTFLQESPRGDLAAGARARLMDALLRQGDEAGARAMARDYLTYHANGPHAEAARSLASTPARQ